MRRGDDALDDAFHRSPGPSMGDVRNEASFQRLVYHAAPLLYPTCWVTVGIDHLSSRLSALRPSISQASSSLARHASVGKATRIAASNAHAQAPDAWVPRPDEREAELVAREWHLP